MQVLILHHDLQLGEKLADMLRGDGRRIQLCRLPHQALRQMRLRRWDAIWVALPPALMDSWRFLSRVRRLQPSAPVVALVAAEPDPDETGRLKDCGVTLVLAAMPRPRLAAGLLQALVADGRKPGGS